MPNDINQLLESAHTDLKKGYTVRAGTRFRQAADTNNSRAVLEFAELVLGKRVPGTEHEVRKRLENIPAPSASLARLRSCLRYGGIGGPMDPDGALRDLNASAQEGHPLSIAEIAVLWNEFDTEQARQATQRWLTHLIVLSNSSDMEVCHLLDTAKPLDPNKAVPSPPPLEAWPPAKYTLQPRKPLSEEPEVYTLSNVLSPLECAWLRDAATPHLIASQIYDAATGKTRMDPIRTSDAMYFSPENCSPLTSRITDKIMSSVKHEASHAEPLAILRYQTGQEYRLHYDWISEESLKQDPLRHAGQRTSTVLVYLNNPTEGGKTIFPLLNLEVEPEQGNLLYFSNANPLGQPAKSTLHAGTPVMKGEKWICSLWIREHEISS